MLGEPFAGWAHINVNGEYIGTASYLDWVPGVVIEPCIRYLKEAIHDLDRWQHIPGKYGLNMEFDAEGWNFGIVEIGESFYTYNTRNQNPPYLNLKEIDLEPYKWEGFRFVQSLMAEAVKDIEEHFEEWVIWDAYDEDDAKQNREDLSGLIIEARRIDAEISKRTKDMGHRAD